MALRNKTESRPLMLSKRANVFYLEHARVIQQDERVVYLTDDGGEFEQIFNIPERNTAFLLLGKGTSITDAAMRRLAASQVLVGFCGSGGSPLSGAVDPVFLVPQSEYRPTHYMQEWSRLWFQEEKRLELARYFLKERVRLTAEAWRDNISLSQLGISVSEALRQQVDAELSRAEGTQELLLVEARWARRLYADLAGGHGFPFKREEGKRASSSLADICNGFLDHGNYIAYGYASVVLCGLGISFAMPVLHGKTRRGALVFDLADIIKDALVMPLAFEYAQKGASPQEFRLSLIDLCQEKEVLDFLFDFMEKACKKVQ